MLQEVSRRGITQIFVAGDLLFGGEDPLGVWKRLVEVKAKCARGVSDAALAHLDPDAMVPQDEHQAAQLERFLSTRKAVGEVVLKYLERLPPTIRVPLIDGSELVVVHGSPADPTLEISHDLDDEEVLALIGDDPADIVACGAAHVPFQRDVADVRVIGLGSVGASPGGGVAHLTVLTPRPDGTLVEQETVEF